jgi:hypothetical protein
VGKTFNHKKDRHTAVTMPKQTIEQRLAAIEERNRHVEQDKAWETSAKRKIIVAILTYITIVLFFVAAKQSDLYCLHFHCRY